MDIYGWLGWCSRKGNGRDFQSIGQASAGLRAAAMLAFLLAHGGEPLVLDQPEDDLGGELHSTCPPVYIAIAHPFAFDLTSTLDDFDRQKSARSGLSTKYS